MSVPNSDLQEGYVCSVLSAQLTYLYLIFSFYLAQSWLQIFLATARNNESSSVGILQINSLKCVAPVKSFLKSPPQALLQLKQAECPGAEEARQYEGTRVHSPQFNSDVRWVQLKASDPTNSWWRGLTESLTESRI